MKVTLFIFILIFTVVFFLMAIVKGNSKDEKAGEPAIWCFACIFSMLMETILCLVS